MPNFENECKNDLEQLAYTLSHDLRKPLRHVTGFAEALKEDYGHIEGLDATALQYIQEMVDATHRMERLLDGILMFARLGTLDEKVPVNIYDVVQEVLKDNGFDLNGVTFSFSMSEGIPLISGSSKLIYQLFGNLVSNSVKFRDKDKPELVVHIEGIPQGDRVVLTVEDNGVTIPSNLQTDVFNLFRRAGPQALTTDGLGVGLAVCQRIMKAHGGSISAGDSRLGGTAITFDLPIEGP